MTVDRERSALVPLRSEIEDLTAPPMNITHFREADKRIDYAVFRESDDLPAVIDPGCRIAPASGQRA